MLSRVRSSRGRRNAALLTVVVAVTLLSSCVYTGTWTAAEAVPVPGTPTSTPWGLTALDCASSDLCLAVGKDAASWNGSTWQYVSSPPVTLTNVSCGVVTCLAIDQTSVWRWSGGTWSPTNWPAGTSVTAVSCASDTACVAVGRDGGGLVAKRWNGTTFTDVTPADRTPVALDISCPSTTTCLAVGQVMPSELAPWNATLVGDVWTTDAPPAGEAMIRLVDCPSTAFCGAVGSTTIGPRYFTGSVNGMTTSSPDQWSEQFDRAMACPSEGSCLTVADHTIYDFTGGSTGWPQVNGGYGYEPQDVGCWSSGCVALAAKAGVAHVLVRQGSGWVDQPFVQPTTRQATGTHLSCASPTVCMSTGRDAGNNGSRLHIETWDGLVWTTIANPPAQWRDYGDPDVLGVDCTSDTSCLVLAKVEWELDDFYSETDLRAFVWNGSAWTTEYVANFDGYPPGGTTGLDCATTTSCLAVAQGRGFVRSGTTWSEIPAPGSVTKPAQAVSCAGPTSCVVVTGTVGPALPATSSQIHTWNGSTFTPFTVPASPGDVAMITDLSCRDDDHCFAVGAVGAPGSTTMRPYAAQRIGTTWTASELPFATTGRLESLSCAADGDRACVAIGDAPTGTPATPHLAVAWAGQWGQLANLPDVAGATTNYGPVSCTDHQCRAIGTATTTTTTESYPVTSTFTWTNT